MTLAPEVQAWIAKFDALGAAIASLPLPEQRSVIQAALDDWSWANPESSAEIAKVSITDHVLAVPGGEIAARVFLPNVTVTPPGVVHFHGGGFMYGSTDSYFSDVRCAHICSAVECVVITVDYRLAPEHKFPTGFEDCYAGLLWAVENAEILGFDRSRLAVAGESAGANLATAVTLAARDRGGPPLALQLLEVPVTDLTGNANLHPSVALFGEGYGLNGNLHDQITDAYFVTPADAQNPYASPLHAPDLSQLPPAHIMIAGMDILRDSGEAYAHRLAEAGVDVSLHRCENHTHGSSTLWQTWAPAREWMDEVIAVLTRALRVTGSRS
jgi:acetyl esterase